MLKVNDKVKPIGECNLSYGYVKKVWVGTKSDGQFYIGKQLAIIYWPQIRQSGRWAEDTLTKI